MPGKLLTAMLLVAIATNTKAEPTGNILQVDYEGYTVWLDCTEHGAAQFKYITQPDSGNAARSDDFDLDVSIPPECQPSSAGTFKTTSPAPRYDRGHMVPVNHLDYSQTAADQTFFMTNILPQTATLNRGAWLRSEEIIECLRDKDTLTVLGGPIWGNDATNDYFLDSHNIRTPDYYWKVIIRSNGKTIAWIMPNDETASKKKLDRYIVTPAAVQKRIGYSLPEVPRRQLKKKPVSSWKTPPGCDLG